MILGQHIGAISPATHDTTSGIRLEAPGWFLDMAGRIGRDFVDARSQLVEVGSQLADTVEKETASLVRGLAARLATRCFRVAIAGRAAAGKSAFVNALAGYPDLATTGASAGTTPVTCLHFNHPTEEVAATFRFVSAADVIRAADLHLGEGAFVCPLTMIDTPDIDESAPLNDDLVLRGIEDADACVIVLSAPQVLARPDAALLRIMHGLRKDRLIVFINRVDELDEAGRQGRRVAEQAQTLLLRELEAGIPVLTGSAKWANAALRSGRCPEDSLAAAKAMARAKAIGAAAPDGLEDLVRCTPKERAEKLGSLLHAASGFPQLYGALQQLLRDGAPAELLRETAATFAAIAQQGEGSARSELITLEENVRTAHSSVVADSLEMHRLKGEIDALDGVVVKLDRISDDRRAALELQRTSGLERLRQELHAAVKDYVARERTAIVFALDRKVHKTGLRFDVSGMRLLLEQAFLTEYGKLHRSITKAEDSAPRHFQRIVDAALPGARLERPFTVVSGSFAYPSLRALGRVGLFDIDPRLWSRWRRRHPTMREAVEEFERLLTVEFLAVVEELAAVAARELDSRAEVFAHRLSLSRGNAVQTVLKRKEELQSRLDYMQRTLSPQAMGQFLAEQLQLLAECRERVALFVRLTRWLDDFLDRMEVPLKPVEVCLSNGSGS